MRRVHLFLRLLLLALAFPPTHLLFNPPKLLGRMPPSQPAESTSEQSRALDAFRQKIPAPEPSWKTDLRGLGLRRRWLSSRFAFRPRWIEPVVTENSIAWGSGHIAVAFLTQEIGGSQSTAPVKASTILHLISLDAATGRIVASRTWPSPGGYACVGANRDGDFVLLQDGGVRVFSPGLHELKRMDLLADPVGSDSAWWLSVPPGGDLVFLRHCSNGCEDHRMLDATSLRLIRSWDKSEKFDCASAKYLATRREGGLYVQAFDSPWRRIADLPSRGTGRTTVLRPVNDDSLIVVGYERVQLLRVDGKTLSTIELPKGHSAIDAWGTTDGRFVAVAAERMTGITIEALDMYRGPAPWRMLIFDSENGNLVSALKFQWRFAFTFCPDRSRAALLSGGTVEMVNLPQPGR
jgi:hypothetical protein